MTTRRNRPAAAARRSATGTARSGPDGDDHERLGDRGERVEDAFHLFSLQTTEDDHVVRRVGQGRDLGEADRERLRALGRVGDVVEEVGPPGHPVEPARPCEGGESRADRLGREGSPGGGKEPGGGGDGEPGVVRLEPAEHRQPDPVDPGSGQAHVEPLSVLRKGPVLHGHFASQMPERDPGATGVAFDHRARGRRQLPEDRGHPRFQDARLLVRDRFERRSEEVGVLELDGRHDPHPAVEKVRRIETAPDPHLDDADVDVRPGEPVEAERRGDLEERRRTVDRAVPLESVREDIDPLDSPNDLRARDGRPVDLDAVAVADEMRGGEQPGPEAVGAQDRLGQRRGGPLPLAAGHVDRGERALRVPQPLAQRGDHLEPRPDTETASGEQSLEGRPVPVGVGGGLGGSGRSGHERRADPGRQ